ncbi:hypothetical_protein (plasmid) [Leishmania braziliensis MHOM/BR/75/M2904]|nr:hypothetical_protein [Leishmania braziliensis MHOM/BR/75/M2904]
MWGVFRHPAAAQSLTFVFPLRNGRRVQCMSLLDCASAQLLLSAVLESYAPICGCTHASSLRLPPCTAIHGDGCRRKYASSHRRSLSQSLFSGNTNTSHFFSPSRAPSVVFALFSQLSEYKRSGHLHRLSTLVEDMATPAIAKMRARSRQQPVRLSDEQKLKRREERENKKSAIPKWLVWSMLVIVVGSSLVNIYFSVVQSPRRME